MGRKTAHIDVQIEKNSAAIRDLISVSRTVIDAQQNTEKHMIRMYSEIKTELELLIKAVNAFPNRIRYSLTYGSSIRQAECHLTAGNQTRDINDLQYESGEICPVCPDCVRNYRTCGWKKLKATYPTGDLPVFAKIARKSKHARRDRPLRLHKSKTASKQTFRRAICKNATQEPDIGAETWTSTRTWRFPPAFSWICVDIALFSRKTHRAGENSRFRLQFCRCQPEAAISWCKIENARRYGEPRLLFP